MLYQDMYINKHISQETANFHILNFNQFNLHNEMMRNTFIIDNHHHQILSPNSRSICERDPICLFQHSFFSLFSLFFVKLLII